jgi:uncharacterized membrane protein
MSVRSAVGTLGLSAALISGGCIALLFVFEGIGVERSAASYVGAWIASFLGGLVAVPLGFVALWWRETRRRAVVILLLTVPIALVVAYMSYAASQMNFDNGF